QIQTALGKVAAFGTVMVTGQSPTFNVTVTGTVPRVAADSHARLLLDQISSDFVIAPDYQFPTIQGIVDSLNTAINNGLASVVAGKTVSIQGGLDLDNKVLSFDIQAHLSAGIIKTLDLGSGFTDLGLKLDGTTVVQLDVGLNLDVTVGLDFS